MTDDSDKSLRRLIGSWQFVRKTRNDFSQQTVKSTGMLKVGQGLWQETGQSEVTEKTGKIYPVFNFQQSYRLSFEDGLKVFFMDGSPFFEIRGLARHNPISHLCGNDLYHGLLYVPNENRFVLRWLVSGPKKSYKMMTEYRKIKS